MVFAVPCQSLPAAVGKVGALIGDRSAVLVASKGLVAAARHDAHRLRGRARARPRGRLPGGPAHAREAVEDGASVVLATHDPRRCAASWRAALARPACCVETTDDVTGAELAACAKNAATLAAAAAAGRAAPTSPGAAAGRVFAEVHELALRGGGRSETFAGLAGAGDLVATTVAEGSRNRRAGELVGSGVPADQIPRSWARPPRRSPPCRCSTTPSRAAASRRR